MERLTAEIAHILFIDLVGYSLLGIEEEARVKAELQGVVLGTREFQRWKQPEELISLDRGDGMALVFFRDPTAPVQCAVEIARAINEKPGMRLRMGVNSGLVSRLTDINGKENVSGDGINMAQRVVDCADAGHILLSQESARVMRQFASWSGSLRDLGECEVKHGVRLALINLHMGAVGNPAIPQKMRPQAVAVVTERPAPPPVADDRPGTGRAQIALLYKRSLKPDEDVLRLLEARLTEKGCEVFIDRRITVGMQWATEIERRIRTADAVIPLLSAASVHSEMLEYEVQQAHAAAQAQGGRPRLLPVRVAYDGPLPEPLAAVLDPLHYSLWDGPQDDEALADAIERAVAAPATPPPPKVPLEAVGGAVPLDSRFYVVRPTDEAFRESMARGDSIVLVKGGRQMGKTSLLARGLQLARERGAKCVRTDFQKLNAAHLESVDTLFLTLGEMIAEQLDLEVFPEEVWNARRGPNVNFERYLRREVLGKLDVPLVWAMDEVDRLFTCPFGSEVFGLFRSWHNERSLDPTGPWARLTLAIAYATEAHLFITDLNQSPFNVGTRLTLDDFTSPQVGELNTRYGSPLRSPEAVTRFHALLGGQPYLTRRGLDQMVQTGETLEALETEADRDEGPFGDHLRRLLVTLSQDPALTEVMRCVLRGQSCPDATSFYRLRSAGLLKGAAISEAAPRCRLYAAYLGRHLL